MPEGEGSLFGDLDAACRVVHWKNPGAEFSENGFASLLKAAETDDKLAEKTASRLDYPLGLLQELLLRTTEAGRSRETIEIERPATASILAGP